MTVGLLEAANRGQSFDFAILRKAVENLRVEGLTLIPSLNDGAMCRFAGCG
jgi:hypothetical protein